MGQWLLESHGSAVSHEPKAKYLAEQTFALPSGNILRTNRFDAPLKVALLFALPVLFGLWLGLGVAGTVLVGVGYGFFTPWVSAFEAFRHDCESRKFLHCIVDGTWGTIKGSCTAVRDFADICYHSFPVYMKELREAPDSDRPQTLRFVHIPACIVVGLLGLIVEIPLYTAIAIIKSPYMLFKGWHQLLHDLISREGPFLETACIPIAGLTILLWPLVVTGSILFAIFSSFFIGLYGSVIVYQERSFRRGAAYVVAMVAEFDEYTNDWLYLREGSILPKPQYRNHKASHSAEFSDGGSHAPGDKFSSVSIGAPAMLVPSLAPSRSVREAIQELKMVQIWGQMMKYCEIMGRELVDANVITPTDFNEWCKAKSNTEATIISVGLPSYSCLQALIRSIKAQSGGLLLLDGVEVTHLNRPQDRVLDWFFYPVMVLKEQIKVIKMGEGELKFLEKVVLFGGDIKRMEAWENGSVVPQDAIRAAQIQGISRSLDYSGDSGYRLVSYMVSPVMGRMLIGIARSISKFPTYRRRFRQVVKALITYSLEKDGSARSNSIRSVASIEVVFLKGLLKVIYVIFAFCSAFVLGALKALLVGPVASLILIIGNVGVILGLFPAHVAWTVYTLIKTNRFDAPLKAALLFALPVLFGLWLGLVIAVTVLAGVGYGFFTPWVSTFEAFRQDSESRKFLHCIVDGTWGTIKGSCTGVRDFADVCYHSFPVYLKELREVPDSDQPQTLRLVHVPACIVVGLMGLIVEIPLYTAIAIIKSPYMLFKGWQRLLHDLISREGPFLETACIPIAGLTILLWPLVVTGSILFAIFSSFFIGLYGSIIVYQERSFRRGAAYVIAMVAEFDEYTNDWLYLREGSILPKPRYRKQKASHSTELSLGKSHAPGGKFSSVSIGAPAMLVPSIAPSRSIREAIQEVKMVQVWGQMMKSCEIMGRELVDANVITPADLNEWCKAKTNTETTIIGLGLPSYSCLQALIRSIKAQAAGLLLLDGVEVTHLNRPQDRVLDWFFHPVMVLKEQIKVIKMGEGELKFLEKVVLFGGDNRRMEAWENGSVVPQDAIRAAQIEGISRRLIGLSRSISKFPTYRRRFHQVVKALITYSLEKDGSGRSNSIRSVASIEVVLEKGKD
ncbi:hypothetical protein HHK36_009948 [Tetracentron sinense]|uniref:Uncharacterized protein n=1 Tax=Tetracentron sinense TaxID=13715 RepID=A0A834ZJX4_TETSI|nr:hypothetical protein HHK36_009948 [Tetracentron sinense]